MGNRASKKIDVKDTKAEIAFKKLVRKVLILTVSFCLLVGGILLIAMTVQQQAQQTAPESAGVVPAQPVAAEPSITGAPLQQAAAPLPEVTFDESAKDAYKPSPVATPLSLKASSLNIPSLGISTSIVNGDAKDGSMVLPESSKVAQYSGAAALTSDKGSTVVAGHVNFANGSAGALGPLYKIVKGAPIYAADASGKVHAYKVTKLDVLEKQALPTEIFRTDGDKQLVIVTCGGDIETVNGVQVYTHNLVVTAEPV